MNPELRNDICYADGLILSGYFPNKELMQYFIEPHKTIIGFTETYFPHESELDDAAYSKSIIRDLFNDEKKSKSSWENQYYMISTHTTHMVKCKSMHDMHEKNDYEHNLRNSCECEECVY
jgi:hypothetical protein